MSLAYSDKKFEKSNQRKALVITLAINSLLFLLIWQVKIWNDSPNPPIIPIQDAGMGEISFEQEAPAPATWKCSIATARANRRSSGCVR